MSSSSQATTPTTCESGAWQRMISLFCSILSNRQSWLQISSVNCMKDLRDPSRGLQCRANCSARVSHPRQETPGACKSSRQQICETHSVRRCPPSVAVVLSRPHLPGTHPAHPQSDGRQGMSRSPLDSLGRSVSASEVPVLGGSGLHWHSCINTGFDLWHAGSDTLAITLLVLSRKF